MKERKNRIMAKWTLPDNADKSAVPVRTEPSRAAKDSDSVSDAELAGFFEQRRSMTPDERAAEMDAAIREEVVAEVMFSDTDDPAQGEIFTEKET